MMGLSLTEIISVHVYENYKKYDEDTSFRKIASDLQAKNIKVTYQTVYKAYRLAEKQKHILSFSYIEKIELEKLLETINTILGLEISNSLKITLVIRILLLCFSKQLIQLIKKHNTSDLYLDLFLDFFSIAKLYFELRQEKFSAQYSKNILKYLNRKVNFELLTRKAKKIDIEKEVSKRTSKIATKILKAVLLKKDTSLDSFFEEYKRKIEKLKEEDKETILIFKTLITVLSST